jgi:hypothetical protein
MKRKSSSLSVRSCFDVTKWLSCHFVTSKQLRHINNHETTTTTIPVASAIAIRQAPPLHHGTLARQGYRREDDEGRKGLSCPSSSPIYGTSCSFFCYVTVLIMYTRTPRHLPSHQKQQGGFNVLLVCVLHRYEMGLKLVSSINRGGLIVSPFCARPANCSALETKKTVGIPDKSLTLSSLSPTIIFPLSLLTTKSSTADELNNHARFANSRYPIPK